MRRQSLAKDVVVMDSPKNCKLCCRTHSRSHCIARPHALTRQSLLCCASKRACASSTTTTTGVNLRLRLPDRRCQFNRRVCVCARAGHARCLRQLPLEASTILCAAQTTLLVVRAEARPLQWHDEMRRAARKLSLSLARACARATTMIHEWAFKGTSAAS